MEENMFHKSLFIFAHQLGERGFYPTYKNLVATQWKPYSEQKKAQEKQLKHLLNFSYKNVPYYHKLFNKLKLDPGEIRTLEDLEKLPILNKAIIKENFEDFKPLNLNSMKYYINSTGGSTGNPLHFRLLKYDRFFNGASLYRGWGYAGYELGDKMVFLAGSSLDVGSSSFIVQKAHGITRNLRKLSSYDMSNEDMQQYIKTINSFKPQFIRGYASSLNFFSKYLDNNEIDIITPQAVFTAAEKLIPHMRKNIENVFRCDVFDGYGLNDGGLGAYECQEHNGLHIDTERSILEIVDDEGFQLENGSGRIIATSLHNYAMPFIRYDTGDMGHIVSDDCGCGRGSRLLKEVMGRQQEILQTPEGKFIYGGLFSRIFWEIDGVKEFQIIQKKLNLITIKMVLEENFDENQLDIIRKIIKSKSEQWEIEFLYVDEIERTKAGKYKFILSEL
ncbi:phenylacetate--CoA ligase family protein [Methanosarcina acetivorans]|uniref:Capsular polysaccharide biosynthesis protein n=2 Tax=Methanosarcina acetivorans TaxID=2214 RepID=Q8TRV6_METAC|nr:phenylacetate--CoA ligase family protein [Methanosarcina acetivorans]AAM04488.1 capsular polysaccharide biosynthesis protein [Methanosarcina acetivorans C2A]